MIEDYLEIYVKKLKDLHTFDLENNSTHCFQPREIIIDLIKGLNKIHSIAATFKVEKLEPYIANNRGSINK